LVVVGSDVAVVADSVDSGAVRILEIGLLRGISSRVSAKYTAWL
jgi:hypothetical protein